ncbi:MAG: hypothetical protein ABSF32_07920 [Ignavibacteria bacterium]
MNNKGFSFLPLAACPSEGGKGEKRQPARLKREAERGSKLDSRWSLPGTDRRE